MVKFKIASKIHRIFKLFDFHFNSFPSMVSSSLCYFYFQICHSVAIPPPHFTRFLVPSIPTFHTFTSTLLVFQAPSLITPPIYKETVQVEMSNLINSKNQKSKNVILDTNAWGQRKVSRLILKNKQTNKIKIRKKAFTKVKLEYSNILCFTQC